MGHPAYSAYYFDRYKPFIIELQLDISHYLNNHFNISAITILHPQMPQFKYAYRPKSQISQF